MKTTYLLIGCLCAPASLALTAYGDTTLYIPSSSVTIGYYMAAPAVNFTFPTPPDVLNFDHIQVAFNAPAGYAFRFSGGEFHAAIEYGRPHTENSATDSLFENSTIDFVPGMANSIAYDGGPTVYENNAGPPPNLIYPGFLHVAVDQGFLLGGAEFTSLTLQWQVDTGYANTSLAPFGVGLFVPNAGSFTFVPIPEPSVAALALLGACATAWRLRSRMHTRMKITP
jgi:hypothetical protein